MCENVCVPGDWFTAIALTILASCRQDQGKVCVGQNKKWNMSPSATVMWYKIFGQQQVCMAERKKMHHASHTHNMLDEGYILYGFKSAC